MNQLAIVVHPFTWRSDHDMCSVCGQGIESPVHTGVTPNFKVTFSTVQTTNPQFAVPLDMTLLTTGITSETMKLALEIADENAKSLIECCSIFHQRQGVRWMEIDLNDGDIKRELDYLKLRSLLEFHPDEKNWVRVLEAK